MYYRVAAIRFDGEIAATDVDDLDAGRKLLGLLEGTPWGHAVAVEIQRSIDGETWETIERRDRDAVDVGSMP
jgi:hypothetical protein